MEEKKEIFEDLGEGRVQIFESLGKPEARCPIPRKPNRRLHGSSFAIAGLALRLCNRRRTRPAPGSAAPRAYLPSWSSFSRQQDEIAGRMMSR